MSHTTVLLKIKQRHCPYSKEQELAVWSLRRMPTMLSYRGRLPTPWDHAHSKRAEKTRQRMHWTTMHSPGSIRLHDGRWQALWMQTLPTELQPEKQKFLFWCWLSIDGRVHRRIKSQRQRCLCAFAQCSTSYIPARKNRSTIFEEQPCGWRSVFRLKKNTFSIDFKKTN